MHLRSLSLRNYRVSPVGRPGVPRRPDRHLRRKRLGQDHLIESLRYAIYGDARTDKWELRSAGVGEDVRVELVFEHEGNTYDVRRRLKGRNLTPRSRCS